jgi:hypothetical protein
LWLIKKNNQKKKKKKKKKGKYCKTAPFSAQKI